MPFEFPGVVEAVAVGLLVLLRLAFVVGVLRLMYLKIREKV
jgi:hypothetical protein